jgi:hypothetical protein
LPSKRLAQYLKNGVSVKVDINNELLGLHIPYEDVLQSFISVANELVRSFLFGIITQIQYLHVYIFYHDQSRVWLSTQLPAGIMNDLAGYLVSSRS